VVVIAVPNGIHEKVAVEALNARKHILVEKPMALTKKECESIIYHAFEQSRQVFCVMQNRYSKPSQWLKKIIQEEILGDIFAVHINCFWNRDEKYYQKGSWHGDAELDGGTLFTQFSHYVDTLYWVFGDIENVQARFSNYNHKDMISFEDSGAVLFNLRNGAIGTFNYTTAIWDKNFESNITVVGAKGTIKIGGQYMNEIQYCHIRDYSLPEELLVKENSSNNHGQVIQNVIDVLNDKQSIVTNALEGMKVVEMIEKIYSLKKQRIP